VNYNYLTCIVWTAPLILDILSLFKQSFIFPFKIVNLFKASSISFESVINKRSEDDETTGVTMAADDGILFLFVLLLVEDETSKLEHNLLNPTSFESISFSSCLAFFLKT